MIVVCSYCTKKFERDNPEDKTLEMLFESGGLKQFCSDACMFAEFEKHCVATDLFDQLDSDSTGFKN